MLDDELLPFCQKCITNQTIVLQALAEYIPDELSKDYSERCESVDLYKVKLEDRYPPVCLQCRSRVEEKIQHNDYCDNRYHTCNIYS